MWQLQLIVVLVEDHILKWDKVKRMKHFTITQSLMVLLKIMVRHQPKFVSNGHYREDVQSFQSLLMLQELQKILMSLILR
jgi:hypothetical protein